MKIVFSEPHEIKNGALAVGVASEGKLSPAAAEADRRTGGAISRAIKSSRFTGKKGQELEIVAPADHAASRIVLCGLGDGLSRLELESLGGKLVARMNAAGETAVAVAVDAGADDFRAAAESIAYGARLRSYRFDRYRTNEDKDKKPTLKSFTVMVADGKAAGRGYAAFDRVADGVFFTRDLVSEPPNVLYPESFAEEAAALDKLGVEVEVLDEAKMRKLGMNSLLGVGQGSARESRLVVMQWRGGAKSKAPVAFVGKGVTFDTGGISIKPAGGMEDMKWDMAGAGVVTGLMKALAGRKAKANVVGIIGLVENMPDGKAQRPGDIVTAMSGQTIEVLNTDAEGRLVLADALCYTQKNFKPQFIVDLATLTGAIIVSLGHEHAGLFSNDDELSERLVRAGRTVGEKLWRMPLDDAYDRMLDSDAADMKNIGGRDAGAITAAQFLKRFIKDVPWAHLDIAGVAWSKKDADTVPKGATGFGVRLLDELVREWYEG